MDYMFFSSKMLKTEGGLEQDRLSTWSDMAKRGRLFICFAGPIQATHVSVIVTNVEITEDEFGIVFGLHYLCSKKNHINL